MPKKTISSHPIRLESTVHALGKNVQDLSILMQKRFDGIDRRFTDMDKRFDTVDRRFTEVTDDIGRMVKQGFDEMDDRFVGLEAGMGGMNARFDNVDAQLGSINRRLNQAVYQTEFVDLEARVTTLERRSRIKRA